MRNSPTLLPPVTTNPGLAGEEARSSGAEWFAAIIAAHGGDAFLRLQSLKISGKGEFTTPPQTGGLTVPLPSFTLCIATGGRNRLDARTPTGPLRFIVHGKDKGGCVSLVGRTLDLPAAQTNSLEPTEFLRDAARERYPVTCEPESDERTEEGKTLRHGIVHRGPGAVTHLYAESDTYLLRKLVANTPRGEMTVLLSDYREVSGLPLFGTLQLLENGANIVKLFCREFTLDEPFKDSLFHRP
jgi:hypothetical protein